MNNLAVIYNGVVMTTLSLTDEEMAAYDAEGFFGEGAFVTPLPKSPAVDAYWRYEDGKFLPPIYTYEQKVQQAYDRVFLSTKIANEGIQKWQIKTLLSLCSDEQKEEYEKWAAFRDGILSANVNDPDNIDWPEQPPEP